MKYLVTGGTGFLGNYITDFLEQAGHEIFIATRSPKKTSDILTDFENNIFNLQADMPPVEYVIHAAGKAHMVPKTEAEKKLFFTINVEGTKLLLQKLETLETLPKGILFISSVAVYGKESGLDIAESQEMAAKDPYGMSKIEAEKILTDWGHRNHVKIAIARLPLIAGKNAPGNLHSMMHGIKTGRYFRIGDGSARKSMVWAGDFASIIPELVQKGGTYNFTDGHHPSFAELENGITASLNIGKVKKLPAFVAKLAGMAGTVIESMTGKKMPVSVRMVNKISRSLTFSDAKARKELAWKPTFVLDHIKDL